MIQNQNHLSPEEEAELALSLLRIHDHVERLRLLHKFFKSTACYLIELFNSDPDAYDNLDTLLYLFFGDSEMLLDEVESEMNQSRKLMQSQKDS